MEEDKYAQILSSCGIKNTKQRKAILQLLENFDKPVSADNIYISLKEFDESISLSTVYRNLELLCSKNILIKSTILNDDRASYELNHMVHRHHLICLNCNKMISIDDCPLKKLEKELHDTTNFDITGHKLEIYGYCPDCKTKK